MPRTSSWRLALPVLALVSATPALAQPLRGCIVTATGVAFGTYDSLTTVPDDGVGAIQAACHPSEHGPVASLNRGLTGTFAARRMTFLLNRLNYNLYSDISRTTIWGDGTSGTVTVTLTGGVVNAGVRRFNRTIYGRIPARQVVPFGLYADLVIVTLTF